MVQVREALAFIQSKVVEAKKLQSASNYITLQEKIQNLLILECKKTKPACGRGNGVGWTLIYLTLFS